MSQEQYGRGKRTSIPTPASQQHRAEMKAREDRREAIKRARAIREDDSSSPERAPSGSRNKRDSSGKLGSTTNEDELDDTARDLIAEEQRRQDLITKIRKRDKREDLANMDEDELQQIWDEGEARKKSALLFSTGSKVKDMGPARPAIAPSDQTSGSYSHKSVASHKRNRSPDNTDSEAKRLRNNRPGTKSSSTKALRTKHSSPARSASSHTRYKPAHKSTPSSPSRSAPAATAGRAPPSSSARHVRPASTRSSSSRAPSPVRSRSSSPAFSRISEQDEDVRRGEGEVSEEEMALDESDIEPDSDSNDNSKAAKNKGNKPKRKRDRGTMGEFAGVERELLEMTVPLVCARLAYKGMFPTPQKYLRIIVKAWEESARELGLKTSKYKVTKRHLQAIRGCVNSFRGRMRDRIKTGLAQTYGLWGKNLTRQAIVKRVKELCPHGLHKLPGAKAGTGHFQHEFIENSVYEAFFTGASPIGAQFRKIFDPFPMRALAVVCAIIRLLVEEYATGKYTKTRMRFDDLKVRYLTYYNSLQNFARNQPERYELVMENLYKNSMARAGFAIDESESELSDTEDTLGDDDFAEDIPTAEELAKLRRPRPHTSSDSRAQEPDSPAVEPAEGNRIDIDRALDDHPATPGGVDEPEGDAALEESEALVGKSRGTGQGATVNDNALSEHERPAKKLKANGGGMSVVLNSKGVITSAKGKSPAQAFARGGLKIKPSGLMNHNTLEFMTHELAPRKGRDGKVKVVGSSSNGKARGGVDTYTTDRGVFGTATYAVAWHQQAHEKSNGFEPSRTLTQSPSGIHSHFRGQFLSSTGNLHFRLNHLVSLLHPSLYHLLLSVRPLIHEHPTIHQLLSLWDSLFLGHSVIMNRTSGEHLDSHGLRRGFDGLLAAGTFAEGDLYFKDMNVQLKFEPGTLVLFDGTTQRHSVLGWTGDQRISNAFFVHRSVFEELGLDTSLPDITIHDIAANIAPTKPPTGKRKRRGQGQGRFSKSTKPDPSAKQPA